MTTQPVDDRVLNTSPVAVSETTDQHTQADDLVERLMRKAKLVPAECWRAAGLSVIYDDGMRYVNPNGPEAAATIKELKAEVESVAQFLHDEGGFDEAWSESATWPEHPDDTGQREGGYVRIVPSDVQAKFRDVARRLCLRFPKAAIASQRPAVGEDAVERVALALLSDDRRDAIATQAINERWPKGWSRSNKLAAMGMVRYAVDAAIAAMQPVKEEG